jgi:hypothetical protein
MEFGQLIGIIVVPAGPGFPRIGSDAQVASEDLHRAQPRPAAVRTLEVD